MQDFIFRYEDGSLVDRAIENMTKTYEGAKELQRQRELKEKEKDNE